MSFRYAHRRRGTYVCGGTAFFTPTDIETVVAVDIETPAEWPSRFHSPTDGDRFFDDWTLDVWFHGKWFATLVMKYTFLTWYCQYDQVFVDDPRDPQSRLLQCVAVNTYEDVTYKDKHAVSWSVQPSMFLRTDGAVLHFQMMAWVPDERYDWDLVHYDFSSVTRMLPRLVRVGWAKVRRVMRLRSIVLYWEELTRHQMQPGGTAFQRDVAEWRVMTTKRKRELD